MSCQTTNTHACLVSCQSTEQQLCAAVTLLEKNDNRLNYRLEWAEKLHRNVCADGKNMDYNKVVLPSVLVGAFAGAAVGFLTAKIVTYFQRK